MPAETPIDTKVYQSFPFVKNASTTYRAEFKDMSFQAINLLEETEKRLTEEKEKYMEALASPPKRDPRFAVTHVFGLQEGVVTMDRVKESVRRPHSMVPFTDIRQMRLKAGTGPVPRGKLTSIQFG